MRSRRDQLQAYQFLARRTTDALVAGSADAVGPHMARLTRTSLSGIMVGVLVMAGFGVVGLIHPGSAKGWKRNDTVVIEKDTGARYAWYSGALHPALNYTSARLAVGGQAKTSKVSRASLRGVTRVAAVSGIAGAPDSLPGAKDLTTGPWSVCSAPVLDPAGRALAQRRTVVLAGKAPEGPAATEDQGVLVSAGGRDTSLWVVWNSARHRIADLRSAAALGLADEPVRVVGAAWLDSVPQGADLRFPALARSGKPGARVAGQATSVGDVLEARLADGTQHAVVTSEGLALVSPVAAELALDAGGGPQPRQIPASALPDAAHSVSVAGLEVLPSARLRPADISPNRRVVCVVRKVSGSGAGPAVVTLTAGVGAGQPLTATGGPAAAATGLGGTPIGDELVMAPGSVAFVRAEPAAGVATGTRYLVTDRGLRYALADDDAVGALGYSSVQPVRVPPLVLSLIPAGPLLSRAAAVAAAEPAGTGSS